MTTQTTDDKVKTVEKPIQEEASAVLPDGNEALTETDESIMQSKSENSEKKSSEEFSNEESDEQSDDLTDSEEENQVNDDEQEEEDELENESESKQESETNLSSDTGQPMVFGAPSGAYGAAFPGVEQVQVSPENSPQQPGQDWNNMTQAQMGNAVAPQAEFVRQDGPLAPIAYLLRKLIPGASAVNVGVRPEGDESFAEALERAQQVQLDGAHRNYTSAKEGFYHAMDQFNESAVVKDINKLSEKYDSLSAKLEAGGTEAPDYKKLITQVSKVQDLLDTKMQSEEFVRAQEALKHAANHYGKQADELTDTRSKAGLKPDNTVNDDAEKIKDKLNETFQGLGEAGKGLKEQMGEFFEKISQLFEKISTFFKESSQSIKM